MPRKTKDITEKAEKTKVSKKNSVDKKTNKKVEKDKKITNKKSEAKTSPKKAVKTTKKATTKTKVAPKKTVKTTKTTAPKKVTKTASKKVTKTTSAKKSQTASTKSKKAAKSKVIAKATNIEYYDLPYRYNQTIVKVLAQTPKNLFIYWDISDADRENYKKQFGENFFETTKPILKVYNDTMHYDFEVEINDFANSWYLPVNDSKCDYRVELARRPINNNSIINQDYIYISSSNKIESPNDRILFNVNEKMVYFRNVKTNKKITKSFTNLSFIRNMGKIYNIYDLYKELYKNEDLEDIYNPSSRFF